MSFILASSKDSWVSKKVLILLRAPRNRSDAHLFLLVQMHHTILEQFTLFKQSSFFFWWGLLHGPQQGPDRMKEKPIRLGKGKLLPKQKNPP